MAKISIVIFVFVLFNIYNCLCIKLICLDISDYERDAILLHNYYQDMEHHMIKPNEGLGIIELYDKERLVWSGDEDDYSESVTIHLLSGEYKLMIINKANCLGEDDEYLELVDGKWRTISEERHFCILGVIVSSSVLDIGDYKKNHHLSVNTTNFGNTVKNYITVRGKYIVELLDNGLRIWEGDIISRYLDSVCVHYRRGKPKLLFYSIRDYSKINEECYYKMSGNDVWEVIDQGEYLSYASMLASERTFEINEYHSNKRYFDIVEYHPYGAPSVTYISKQSVLIREVKDQEEVIWESDGDTKCVYAIVTLKNEEPSFLLVHIEAKETHGNIFYEKTDGKWCELERDPYYDKLELLDAEEDISYGVKSQIDAGVDAVSSPAGSSPYLSVTCRDRAKISDDCSVIDTTE